MTILTGEQSTFAIVDRLEINRERLHAANCRFCNSSEIEIGESGRCGLGAAWLIRCKKTSVFFVSSAKVFSCYTENCQNFLSHKGISSGNETLLDLDIPPLKE